MKKTLSALVSFKQQGKISEEDYKFVKNIITTFFEAVSVMAANANSAMFLFKLKPGEIVDEKIRSNNQKALSDLKSKFTYNVGLTMSQFEIKGEDSNVMNDCFIEDLKAIKIDEK